MVVAMIDFTAIVTTALINAITGLITNVFYILLAIWSVKTLVREVPHWIEKWEDMKEKERRINWARGAR